MNEDNRTDQDTVPEPALSPRLLEILVCPVSRTTLVYDRTANELISHAAGLAYPIRDGIPIMLPEEARALADGPAGPSSAAAR